MTRSTGIPAPGWPTIGMRGAADDQLGAPAIAELVDVVDPAGHRHESPEVGRRRCGEQAERQLIAGPGGEAVDVASRAGAASRRPCPSCLRRGRARRSTRRAVPVGQQDLDRAGRILDDDPAPGRHRGATSSP